MNQGASRCQTSYFVTRGKPFSTVGPQPWQMCPNYLLCDLATGFDFNRQERTSTNPELRKNSTTNRANLANKGGNAGLSLRCRFLIHPDIVDEVALRKDAVVDPLLPAPASAYGEVENEMNEPAEPASVSTNASP